MDIELFKKKIIEDKVKLNTLSPSNETLFDEIYQEQRKYGDDYKPKDSLFSRKCPNCNTSLSKTSLGKKWYEDWGEFWHFFILSCKKCSYKYAEFKRSQ
jgi:hypothetical protein